MRKVLGLVLLACGMVGFTQVASSRQISDPVVNWSTGYPSVSKVTGMPNHGRISTKAIAGPNGWDFDKAELTIFYGAGGGAGGKAHFSKLDNLGNELGTLVPGNPKATPPVPDSMGPRDVVLNKGTYLVNVKAYFKSPGGTTAKDATIATTKSIP